MALPALRERKHPYCERPEYARGVRLSLGGSIYDPADPMSKMFFKMLAVFAGFAAGLLKMRTREGMAHRPLPRQAQRQQAQAHHTPAGRVLDRAGARPGAQLRDSLDRRPASSRSRAPVLPGRAISVVRRESLSATLSPVVHSIPEDDWVSAEAEALLDATPGLREDLRAAMDELHAGTLQTVDAATARARIETRIKSRGSS